MSDPYITKRVRRAYVDVIGKIWMPSVQAAMTYHLSDFDLSNIGEFTRDNVDRWLSTHAGDFATISDFHAVCGETEIPWDDEEAAFTFADLTYPEGD